ncbi:ABC transporter substrate-binding protein [Paenibacillus endoradicis]|uniref:ABC transporter substrate-binding protein n=1 Tax=Paenibacillus endoradicis TaxID=2972487 RepID=UPI002159A3BC|nr:ABC transporter substrate-binding protein [Paenibacillus endoradicis]MCR8660188.1 ABC transporter substrate-binding protein [Paenibacillus endoradicis]
MKKSVVLILTLVMVILLAACGTNNNAGTTNEGTTSSEKTTIIITNGKGEIAAQWEQAAKDFMAVNPDIIVEAHTQAVGDTLSIVDKLTASGKTVTLAMVAPDTVNGKYKDFGIDLSGEAWITETDNAFSNEEGMVVGFPFSIEGLGLVYNKTVVEKAVGGEFDPFSINTRDKLVALLDQIKASGVEYPVAYQTEGWSVANHFSTQFLNQNDEPSQTVSQIKSGELKLADNATWNGYYDTLDVLVSKDYNKYGERPIGVYYDDAHVSVGNGTSAMLFNGNWAYDSLQAVAGEEFGFIPVPVDNDPENPLNNKIVAGPTNLLVINKKATAEQQAAAKKFLDWIVFDEAGQNFLVNESQVISAFKNNPNKVANPLGAAIASAVEQGKTADFALNYTVAEDWSTKLAPEVQKYVAQKLTRAELATFIENYFKSFN